MVNVQRQIIAMMHVQRKHMLNIKMFNLTSRQLLTSGSSAVNGCRQNVQTADKNITIIHKKSTPLQSINYRLVKFIIKRQSIINVF